jgi:hypothetical protein
MKRNTLNFWIDVVSLFVMVALIWTGLLIHYVLPPGTGGRHGEPGLTVFGMGRHDYGDIHFYLALVLIGLMLIHVWLHWSWVYATINKLLGTKSMSGLRSAIYGIVLLVIIAGLTIGGQFWAKSRVKRTPGTSKKVKSGHGSISFAHVSGQTTLADAAKIGGIPVEKLISQLRLPADVDIDERLGRLKRQYGFEIHEVREILERNKQ